MIWDMFITCFYVHLLIQIQIQIMLTLILTCCFTFEKHRLCHLVVHLTERSLWICRMAFDSQSSEVIDTFSTKCRHCICLHFFLAFLPQSMWPLTSYPKKPHWPITLKEILICTYMYNVYLGSIKRKEPIYFHSVLANHLIFITLRLHRSYPVRSCLLFKGGT